MICKHCKSKPANKCRGLCWTCFYTPGVKEQYPRLTKFGWRSTASFIRQARPPSSPTRAAPGTLEKVLVLAGRVDRGECLFHPQDARL